ncbi:MAG: hypothetical protein C0594_06030 [Marinilabiliales bacterium]|nr:MAG: hypothetical protein C0594_06030 [Marinilabiliales bacterium]
MRILKKAIPAYPLFCVAIFLSSCATNSLNVTVLKPAEITIPSAIQKVAIVNRSLADDDSKVNNIIEGVITGEGIFVDREASGNCLNGLSAMLTKQPRFDVVFPQNVDYLKGTGTAEFPPPLKWGDIEKICKDNKADALIALETFDSNSGTKFENEKKTRKDQAGNTQEYYITVANMDIAISAGWRIYWPEKKKIVDQNVFVDHKHWDTEGNSREEASKKLPSKRMAVKDAGFFAGEQYGWRISPAWVSVGRMYYVKANDDFKDAKYKVRANAWDEASAIWKKHVNSPDKKIAGRATYNMALACEVKGDLVKALDWAKISYKDHYNKKARTYIHKLENRLWDQKKLDEQMQ